MKQTTATAGELGQEETGYADTTQRYTVNAGTDIWVNKDNSNPRVTSGNFSSSGETAGKIQ